MKKAVIMLALKQIGNYLKDKLLIRLQKVFIRTWNSIKKSLWQEIKLEVRACAREVIRDAEIFLASVEAQEKEKIILDIVMSKIELPFVLKPFKGIIRKILKNKIEATIIELMQKSKNFVG